MIVLALDTALAATSVAVLDGNRVLSHRLEPMERGHQERLAIAVRDAMLDAALAFSALERIGVTVGPGSFTGVRVGLAFAKGLALSLDIPCVGVGTLEALAASVPTSLIVVTAVDARRGGIYLQAFKDGVALVPPAALNHGEAVDHIRSLTSSTVALAGPGAGLLADELDSVIMGALFPDARDVARLAGRAAKPLSPPKPLYLRSPDAKTLIERRRAE